MPVQASGFIAMFVGQHQGSSGVQPKFLGTGETGPDVHFHPDEERIQNDRAGSRKPYDIMYMGQDATVSITLTEWDQPILNFVKAFPGRGSVPGVDRRLARGSLFGRANLFFPVWLLAHHRNDPVMTALGMPKGIHFFQCKPTNIIEMRGRRANKVRLELYAHAGEVTTDPGAFECYNEDITAVEGIALPV